MDRTVELLRAMGEESRLRILLLLEQAGELSVADLSAALELPQPKVSRHLSRLRLAGWVKDRRWRGFSLYRVTLQPGDTHREYLLNLTELLHDDNIPASDYQRLIALRRQHHSAMPAEPASEPAAEAAHFDAPDDYSPVTESSGVNQISSGEPRPPSAVL